ncbi:glycosyl hydrolase [Kitasatospora sp. NPDC049258]|uniref:glycoside hydrolase family 26 protein n=1 Tax=Kitasatospora sp. NPDC049258 TaxID=3155394 RepID=UPI003428FDC4
MISRPTAARAPRLPRPALLLASAALLLTACTSTGTPAGTDAAAPSGTAASPSPAAPYDVSALRSPGGRLLGVASAGSPDDLDPVNAFAAKAGHQPDLREYYQEWGDDFDPDENTKLWRHGQLPLLSWDPTGTALPAIASGSQDDYLGRFADQVRSYQGPLAISFAQEMNGPWNPWGPGHASADDYVRAWQHVHDVFRDRKATNVLWVWAPHVTDSGAPTALPPYFPGDEYVDWLGLVGYYGPQDGADYRHLFAPTVKVLRTLSRKPLLITETGVAEGPRKTAQIADLFTGAAGTDGLIGLVWYDLQKKWPGSSQLTDWRVDSSAAAAAAVTKAAAERGFGYPLSGPQASSSAR